MIRYFLAAGCAAIAFPVSAASFVSQQYTTAYDYPDSGTEYASASFTPATFMVGSGVETVGDVEGVTSIGIDFTADTLTVSLSTILSNPTWTSAAFNGPIFTSPSAVPFTHVALGARTNLPGFDLSRVLLSNHQIGINWNGLTYTNGSMVELIFSGAVPEPASWAMMLTGFGAIGGAARMRRRPLTFAG